ncbi:MAG: FxsA family protein, partial [Rhodobiaceae bacterium]|nr:FxsA family protein [Rhodobiaceae bacterium]
MPVIFLLFVLVPIAEIALFIEVGDVIGLWPTLGIVVATAFLGTGLLRAQGLAA